MTIFMLMKLPEGDGKRVAGFPFITNVVDDRRQFAYQGIAGLAVPIPGVPGLAITAEYRYFATLDARFRGRVVGDGLNQSLRTKTDNQNHSALLGIRFAFGK
jgi:OOP family OmpA-OmpF porin